MKRIIVPTILGLIFCFQLFGQEKVNCPTIKVIPPSGFTSEGDEMTFFVLITGDLRNSNLEYKWTVSKGKISEGQSTALIRVQTTSEMTGQTITATVEIKGVPEGCKNSASASGKVDLRTGDVISYKIEGYEKLLWQDERDRWRNLTIEISKARLDAKVYIFFSVVNDSELKLVSARQKKILKFLESRKISSPRILMKVEKGNVYQTAVWIVPEGTNLPDF